MWSPLSGTRRDRRVALVVLGGTFLSVCAVYVVVVLGGGLLIGHTDSPHVGLSILATAIVALGLEPLRSWLEGVAKRWVQGDRATPYDVLSRFTESLAGEVEPDHVELPLRMARLLAEGTGARWAEVWLMVDGEPDLAAAWPPEAGSRQHQADGDQPGVRSLDVTLDRVRLGDPAAPGAPRPAAVAGRGTPVRRPRGPGGSGAPRCCGCASSWRSGPRTWRPWPRPSRSRADVSSTPTTPNGGDWNATSTTGPSSTWSRSSSTSASPTP